jgi:hypothetical protein
VQDSENQATTINKSWKITIERWVYTYANGLKGGLSLLPPACPLVSAKLSILLQMAVYQSLKSNGKKGE